MFMGLPNCIEIVNEWACPKLKLLSQRKDIIKCFVKINENVRVNRAPIWIRHSGRVRDSGRDIFEKKRRKFNNIENKKK